MKARKPNNDEFKGMSWQEIALSILKEVKKEEASGGSPDAE